MVLDKVLYMTWIFGGGGPGWMDWDIWDVLWEVLWGEPDVGMECGLGLDLSPDVGMEDMLSTSIKRKGNIIHMV